jgi:ABC-type sugar transport system permease subunit
MVIFMAGWLSISKSLYEAADLDGTGRGSNFFPISFCHFGKTIVLR